MRNNAGFPPRYWQSALRESVRRLGEHYQTVLSTLVTGPYSHVTGIYGLQIHQLAEDLGMEPDEVRGIIAALEDLGWCTYARPVIWIHGLGCQADQLGRDFRRNPSDLIATLRHVEALPADNGAVIAWRSALGLAGVTADDARRLHPNTRSQGKRDKGGGKRDKGTVGCPTGGTTGGSRGNGALREGKP